MKTYEETLHADLHQYLQWMHEADERLPQCPDVEEKWEELARAYLPDGIREFAAYPTASLGWMMYIGMAVACWWEEDWEVYSHITDLYAYMRDKRGYDQLDEYIREDVLQLHGDESAALERLAGECASRTHNLLRRQAIEPGTKQAFDAYVSSLHQLYLMGVAVQLRRMGYHMCRVE